MFKKILIANRGEIAVRIIKTARRMGIASVAVYSEADKRALHVEMADEAVLIGPAPAAQSYLAAEKIIEAAGQNGAEAVHPGYGFLSERASFAAALAAAGIIFIGPNPRAIEAMGDKVASKKAAAAAGVSVVPGHIGVIEDAREVVRIAEAIGYPVMIKASAGGGGKGMRVAHSVAELMEGFLRAKSEAKSSFGDDRVFIEKFIVNPRHIEIQVLGDRHGNIIHLGERECSIQRRNQKVIEESPSPLLDEKTRAAMGAQAVALARAVNYDSAGTVEFVAGQDKSFYFLEMNTRLQVEHPVTELVTGVDLVEQMIRVAAGEKLALKQKDVKQKGWAIEARIYAEDPARGFVPSTGRLIKYRPPAEQPGAVRNDTGVYEGGEISLWYDPMIAKLCTHAATRTAAIDAMAVALDQFHIEGIQHNIPFLAAIMQNARWRQGALSTGFIEQEFPGGFKGAALTPEIAAKLAQAACDFDRIVNRRAQASPCAVRLGDGWHEATPQPCDWRPGQGVHDGIQLRAILGGFSLSHRGVTVDAHVYSPREAELIKRLPPKRALANSNKLLCPMPGRVLAIAVHEGQEVKTGEALAIVEAMKMENTLRAERDAVIKKITARQGDTLAMDSVILEFA